MTLTATEFAASQAIGVVESVSPREITVRLDPSAPQATALNAGHVQRFPRINGWVLIANEVGYLVGTVTWLGIEPDSLSAGSQRGDRALLDLPFPRRRLKLSPLGTLLWRNRQDTGTPELVRGVVSYPSVGEVALVPTSDQIRHIAQAASSGGRVRIGTSPLAGGAEVLIDPDRVFGRHLAVLGNTGSGKSCTVAGLIRWSLEAARENVEDGVEPNARFIVLDPNGEYANCFADLSSVRAFRVQPAENDQPLTVPSWMWTSAEWAAITRAAPQTQRPLLQQALRQIRAGNDATDFSDTLPGLLSGFASLWASFASDVSSYSVFPKYKSVTTALKGMVSVFGDAATQGHGAVVDALNEVIDRVGTPHFGQYDNAYQANEVHEVRDALLSASALAGSPSPPLGGNEDAPIYFDAEALPDHMAALSLTPDFASASGHATFLINRVRGLLADLRLRDIICPADEQSLAEWLSAVLGEPDANGGQIAVLDLSLLASDVIHTAVGVLGRIVMEAVQYVRRITGTAYPTVLVLEEAHNFVGRSTNSEDSPTTADLCRQTFEKISREGRKYGLGLVISSQRPSALSQTVLSQCNTFLLHRLVNDRDQDLVARLVPDAVGELLQELPSLPSRQAILLGWATPMPTLIEIGALAPEQRPDSHDPEFWRTWTGEQIHDFTWEDVANLWTGHPS
jgi:hypothetical protein